MVVPSIPELLARLNEVDEAMDIEAKRAASEVGKSALETISAFANEPGLGGGYLLFGVEEAGVRVFRAAGVADPKKVEQAIASLCASEFNRTIRPRIWTEVIAGAPVVAAFIPEAGPAEKPIFLASKGIQHGTFRRIGSGDTKCTEDDLRVLFQASVVAPYEDTVPEDASMEDLDPEVIGSYRKSFVEANPATELRDASLEELVQSVGGARRVNGALLPTVAGLLLFGKRLSLRRLFPALRIDYIRVPGTEWVQDPDRRYGSVEVREPLLVAFRRIYNAVVDDLPRSFSLEPGSPERKDILAVPEKAIRESLVNALTHRDYRVPSTIQVIRYRDRIEFRNPGYSLVDEEHLGEPGSCPRNPRMADVFREMHLAENKGTGISAIRKAMKLAQLTPPLFDSDRTRNLFVVSLLLHNLMSEEDAEWLRRFSDQGLSNEQACALVIARRQGTVTNAMLRDVTGLDTLRASAQLRQLRDAQLLDGRGKGAATHYVLGPRARIEGTGQTGDLEPKTQELGPQTGELGPQTGELGPQTGELGPQTGELGPQTGEPASEPRPNFNEPQPREALLSRLPVDLRQAVERLGGKPSPRAMERTILAVCQHGWWTPRDLANLLARRKPEHLSEKHISPLVKKGLLERRYPETVNDPRQAVRSTQAALQLTDEDAE
jgi:ATP-dependent DNA helicase RecG